jgi:hypothetical protein
LKNNKKVARKPQPVFAAPQKDTWKPIAPAYHKSPSAAPKKEVPKKYAHKAQLPYSSSSFQQNGAAFQYTSVH